MFYTFQKLFQLNYANKCGECSNLFSFKISVSALYKGSSRSLSVIWILCGFRCWCCCFELMSFGFEFDKDMGVVMIWKWKWFGSGYDLEVDVNLNLEFGNGGF